MTQLFEQKSLLGKLLASENLVIEHKKVPTAYFNLKARTITLPTFKEMTGEVYDLLVSHEVSHGLHTPAEGWHDAVIDNKALKSYLNVVEDARIERKIKEKFPGLRRSFNIAYKKLHDDNFFGIQNRDVNKMLLIDRINMFYKLGAYVKVTFTADELPFIDEINAAETWEDVVRIANKLYARAQEEAETMPNQPPQPQEDDYDDTDDDSFEESESDSDDYEDGDGDGEGSGEEESDDGEDSEEGENGYDDNAEGDEPEKGESEDNAPPSRQAGVDSQYKPDVSSETDNAFRENEKKLVDDSSGETVICNLPEYNGKHIIDCKNVNDSIVKHFQKCAATKNSYNSDTFTTFIEKASAEYNDFLKRTTPVVNYMVKEFEMRKNASQMARAKTGKSGKIDSKKLARYGMTSDIFKRITTVSEGKNHGLVLFMDLSGSMDNIYKRTMEQVIVLTRFCQKVNIPFDVYGFSDSTAGLCKHLSLNHEDRNFSLSRHYTYTKLQVNDLYVNSHTFHLKHFLSSNMSATKYREACKNLHHCAWIISDAYGYNDFLPQTMALSGTPLDEALIASVDIVDNFKTKYRLDNVNCIFLTDGEGGFSNHYVHSVTDGYPNHRYIPSKASVYLQHKKTKFRVKCKDLIAKTNWDNDSFRTSRGIIELAKQVTGAKYTGYYIGQRSSILNKIAQYENQAADYKGREEARKEKSKTLKDDGFASSTKFGFDEYFMVLPENLKIDENKLDDELEGKSKGVIGRAFIKNMKGRGLQRMFLNRFMENIAA